MPGTISAKAATAVFLLACCGPLCGGQEQQSAANPSLVPIQIVKGVPFSARAVTEANQTLADGNRISRSSVALVARDSEGRTRREQRSSQVGPAAAATPYVAFIQDPLAEAAYILEPQSRLARKWPVRFGELLSTPPATPTTGTRTEATDFKTEALGIQIIDGIEAEGTRISRTLTAGQTGNERPLDIISEIWYSTELQTILLKKTVDPRVGETIYRLTEIQRAEPPRSLFEVPADYTIRDERESRPDEKLSHK